MECIGYKNKGFLVYLVFSVLIALAGCSPSGSSENSGNVDNTRTGQDPMALDLVTLYSTVTSITVHVVYEPDAEPFIGTFSDGGQYWSVLENNLNAIFIGRIIEPEIYVPKDLTGMEQISDQDQTSWTTAQVFDLAKRTWDTPQTSTSAEFYVLFLNGYFNDQGVTNKQVVGISIVGTPVIAVFKDAIRESGYTSFYDKVMEQTTLVHEFGHAVGLVNSGLDMVLDHEDTEHINHCTNEDCVMYWENDGTSLNFFIQKIINSPSDVLFGPECLNDAGSFMP
jgi:predicted Zn-dependent protease